MVALSANASGRNPHGVTVSDLLVNSAIALWLMLSRECFSFGLLVTMLYLPFQFNSFPGGRNLKTRTNSSSGFLLPTEWES
jgi:hypothetical protein